MRSLTLFLMIFYLSFLKINFFTFPFNKNKKKYSIGKNRNFIKGKEASKILGVSQQTLKRLGDEKKIEVIKTDGGQRTYNVVGYLMKQGILTFPEVKEENLDKEKHICYCRVSIYGQKEDLERQIKYMEEKYKNYEIISDIGSGINFNRAGLRKIIDYGIEGKLKTLVVSYKDRLCRIGYSLIEYILVKYSDTNIIIDSKKEGEEGEEENINEEIAKDVLEIITVYSAKIHGMRRYKNDM